MALVCAHSSAAFGSWTLPPRVLSQSAKRCRTHQRSVVRAASSGDLFFVANNVFKVCSLKYCRNIKCCSHGHQLHFALSQTLSTKHKYLQVKKEGCQQFEEIWKNRESNLKDNPGFVRFALLKGDEEGRQSELFMSLFWVLLTYPLLTAILGEYISQSTWASRQDFKKWTQSQSVSPCLMLLCMRLSCETSVSKF